MNIYLIAGEIDYGAAAFIEAHQTQEAAEARAEELNALIDIYTACVGNWTLRSGEPGECPQWPHPWPRAKEYKVWPVLMIKDKE